MNLGMIGNGIGAALGGLIGRRPGHAPGQVLDPQEVAEAERREATREYQPTTDETKLVRIVEERFEVARQAKDKYTRTWARSLAFYLGEQWLQWEPVTRRMLDNSEEIPSWRQRIVDNQITVMVLTWAAKQNQARHTTIALPNNPKDPADVAAAAIGTKALRHLERITERGGKRRQVELLRAIYGTCVLMPYWDPAAQTTVAFVDPASGQVSGREAYIGDQQFEVLSVWEVFPQPVQRWADVAWCIKGRTRTLDWIRETFPDRGALVSAQDPEQDLFALSSAHALQAEQTGQEPSARVLEYYERPCKRYPQGRWLVVAGGILLYAEDRLPHPKGDFPFVEVFGIANPESLWGMGIVEHLIGQQEELNRTESRIAEDCQLTARPKFQAAREAKVDEQALHSGPGEVVEWNWSGGAPPPGPMQSPNLPPYVAELPERIIDRMGRIAGINEVSRADTPSSVSSGVAISLLQETDNTRFSFATDDEADAWRRLDGQMLRSIAARYTVPRMVRVLGTDQGDEALALMGTDLGANTEVGLESTEGVNDSIAAVRQRILDYVQNGMFSSLDPRDLGPLFRIMGESQLAEFADERAARILQEQAAQAAALQEQEAAAMEQEQAAQAHQEAREDRQRAEEQEAQQLQAAQQQEAQAQQLQLQQQQAAGQLQQQEQATLVRLLQSLVQAESRQPAPAK